MWIQSANHVPLRIAFIYIVIEICGLQLLHGSYISTRFHLLDSLRPYLQHRLQHSLELRLLPPSVYSCGIILGSDLSLDYRHGHYLTLAYANKSGISRCSDAFNLTIVSLPNTRYSPNGHEIEGFITAMF